MADPSRPLIVLARSGPGSAGARLSLRLCSERVARGAPTTLVLIGDATALLPEATATGASVAWLVGDAALRGLGTHAPEDLRELDEGQLVDLLFGGDRVVGAL